MRTRENSANVNSGKGSRTKAQSFFGNSSQHFFDQSKTAPDFFQNQPIQTKLEIGEPGDKYEQEADAMADQVMKMESGKKPMVQTKCDSCGDEFVQKMEEEETAQPKLQLKGEDEELQTKSFIQRKCKNCEEKESVQRKPLSASISVIQKKEDTTTSSGGNDELQTSLNSSKGSGTSMDDSTLSSMNNAFGHDFSSVKIHTGSNAVQMNQQLGARAFTNGSNVYFNQGQYSPNSDSGKHLLAHELTHVVQQRSGMKLIQRKVVDSDYWVPCRNTRAGAVADLTQDETDAISLGKRASGFIYIALFEDTLNRSLGGTESARLHAFRDALWRRFHRDFNDPATREQFLPLLARRYELVAGWIERLNHRYTCGAPGNEPAGECTNQPGVGLAWTATGLNTTELCESYWNLSQDDQAETILHEMFHFGFDWLSDCGVANRNNTVCFDMFAGELNGTASPNDYLACCAPPSDPLPAYNVNTP